MSNTTRQLVGRCSPLLVAAERERESERESDTERESDREKETDRERERERESEVLSIVKLGERREHSPRKWSYSHRALSDN
uniref:Uncharacterized protein n=1 Tax=Octopus bimaculoides TaxID=37653 RepID=A0A0L8I6D9_OCTBM